MTRANADKMIANLRHNGAVDSPYQPGQCLFAFGNRVSFWFGSARSVKPGDPETFICDVSAMRKYTETARAMAKGAQPAETTFVPTMRKCGERDWAVAELF